MADTTGFMIAWVPGSAFPSFGWGYRHYLIVTGHICRNHISKSRHTRKFQVSMGSLSSEVSLRLTPFSLGPCGPAITIAKLHLGTPQLI